MQLRRSARLLAGVSAAAILLSSGAGWATVRHHAGQVQRIDAFGEEREAPAAGEPITFLVVGSDSREGLSDRQVRRLHTGWDVYGQRTDTMMLAHVGRDGEVTVVSLPWDSWPRSPPTPTRTASSRALEDKLNAAYSYGGAPSCEDRRGDDRRAHRPLPRGQLRGGSSRWSTPSAAWDVCVPPPDISIRPGSGTPAPPFDSQGPRRSAPSGPLLRSHRRHRADEAPADLRGQHGPQGPSSEVLLDPAKATGFVDAMLSSMRVDQSLDNAQVLELTRRLAEVDPSQVTFRTVPRG